jgi:protocatechuate 3,4-dioxygenase beta subunit
MSGRGGLVVAGIVVALGLGVLLVVGAGAGWIMLGGSSLEPATLLETEPEAPVPTAPNRGEAAESSEPAPLPRADGGVEDGAAGAATAGMASDSTLAPLEAGMVQAIAVSKRTEQPLEGAVLTLTPSDPESSDEGFTSDPSGADGRITLTNVAAGDYTLRLTRPGCESAEQPKFAMAAGTGRDLGAVALVPTPAATGTVTRLDGSAAQGATVVLVNEVALALGPDMSIMDVIADLRADEVEYAAVNADAQGRYTIWWDQALPGDYAIRASVAESATAHRGIVLDPQAVAERDFQLGQPVVLAGTVLDHDGNPCTGCRIIAVPEPDQQMMMGGRKMMLFKNVGVVNATGAFRFDHLTAGSYMLFAGGGGYTQKMIQNVVVPNIEYAIQLERGVTLRGRVADARTGDPIAGAKIAVGGDGGFDVGTTDDAGHYEFTGLGNRNLDLFVEAAGYPPVQRRVPRDADRALLEFDVELDPGLVLEGRVVSAADRRGIAGAKVIVLPANGGFTPGGVPRTDADAEGRFAVRGVSLDPRGMGRVEVRVDADGRRAQEPKRFTLHVIALAPGYAFGEPLEVQITEGEQPAPIEVPLLVAARVQGRVVDGAGNPVAGASVSWTQRNPTDQPADPNDPTAGFDNTSMMMAMMLPDQHVRTGADGGYVLTDVRPGTETVVTAKHAKLAAASSKPFPTEGGKAAAGPELKLSAGATLVVVALDANGEPAVGQSHGIGHERAVPAQGVGYAGSRRLLRPAQGQLQGALPRPLGLRQGAVRCAGGDG